MKDKDLPFVKKFRIGESYYIYDVNSNKIFEVDFCVYHFIDKTSKIQEEAISELKDQGKYSQDNISKAITSINDMKNRGIFSNHRPQITFFTDLSKSEFMENLKDILNNRLHRLTLVVCESCNQRCRYCVYSGKYLYNRKHSAKKMSPEIMKKAIDFYFSRSNMNEEKSVSFFGGEPILNFSLIKECVNYIKNKYTDSAQFNMTTNGTLLNGEIIDFLIENHFSLLISIDGPKEIHDRYRIFKNGKGTYECLMKNLMLIKKTHPEYYKTKVRFNMVLTPPLDLNKIDEFISNKDIRPAGIKFGRIKMNFNSFVDQINSTEIKSFHNSKRQNLESFQNNLARGIEPNEIETIMFRRRFLDIHKRKKFPLPPKFPSHGQCMLGERSLFINTDGTINFCSRVNDVFNLGNVDTDYDYNLIEKLYFDLDKLLAKRCYNCWAIRFCMKCINDFNRNGKIDDELLNEVCRKNQSAILNEIKDYIEIRNSNPNAFEYLESITTV